MRLLIAGTHSGVGKTMITAGLIAALRKQGEIIQPFKVGPDYIDPSYHTLAAGRPCRNLDSWMVPADRLAGLFNQAVSGATLAVIEGVMGLFDGLDYEQEVGSTGQVAKLTLSPVVLVVDASHMARTAGAVALGFQKFDPDLNLAGVILNKVSSEQHGAGVAAAVKQATGLPVLGWLPRNPALELNERHLGLVPTAERGLWKEWVEAAGEHVARSIDLEKVMAIARQSPPLKNGDMRGERAFAGKPAPVLAVARDEAFSFIYEDNLDLLRAAGAQIVFFSPLNDTSLPPETSGILLSGGFPELYAEQLSANEGMRLAFQRAQADKVPIYAECGGLMTLTESICDQKGCTYPMFGLLPGRSVMTGKLTLGYREARAVEDTWLMQGGEVVRGHEFHYSTWVDRPKDLQPAYHLLPVSGSGEAKPEGACMGNLWASYIHLHFWGTPFLAERITAACRTVGEARGGK